MRQPGCPRDYPAGPELNSTTRTNAYSHNVCILLKFISALSNALLLIRQDLEAEQFSENDRLESTALAVFGYYQHLTMRRPSSILVPAQNSEQTYNQQTYRISKHISNLCPIHESISRWQYMSNHILLSVTVMVTENSQFQNFKPSQQLDNMAITVPLSGR